MEGKGSYSLEGRLTKTKGRRGEEKIAHGREQEEGKSGRGWHDSGDEILMGRATSFRAPGKSTGLRLD
jgi:hypothetical protein